MIFYKNIQIITLRRNGMEKLRKSTFVLLLVILTLPLCVCFPKSVVNAESKISLDKIKNTTKAYYLVEEGTGEVLLSSNENERLKIASMVKIMSMLLVLEEIEKGTLSFDQQVTISENAAKTGGSQIFLDKGSKHTIENLLKSVLVASANDSVVALSEIVAGSEENFVKKMNEKAKILGMNDTLFENATGLPTENQYSTAKDVSIMFRALISHKKVFELGKIWTEDYVHPSGRSTIMTNTNKLVRFYDGCDMGKTGYTSGAKHCLSATAKRDDMRVIAVVIGANSSKERFYAVSSLFNYAFENYENKAVITKDTVVGKINVKGGRQKSVDLMPTSDVRVLTKKGENAEFSTKICQNAIKSPIKKGDKVAKLEVSTKYGKKYYDLVSCSDVLKATYIDSIENIFLGW